jgi:EAL domain-containing protein (putative c-di-GMP-specific phosphodiesterase class I)/ActR/RegA family two-component response regulator
LATSSLSGQDPTREIVGAHIVTSTERKSLVSKPLYRRTRRVSKLQRIRTYWNWVMTLGGPANVCVEEHARLWNDGRVSNAATTEEPAEAQPISVLVVDDEPAIARVAERVLTRVGFRVTTATGGRAAIEEARATPFDAIVSDLAMPDMDGRALLRAIRALDLDVPFVFLTGSPNLESAIEAIEYGAFRYLLKPVPAADLVDVVKRAVSWHRLAVVRREAARELTGRPIGDRAGLEARFTAALETLWIATQPIVSCQDGSVLAYETLARTEEPTLSKPTDLFDAAERLHRTADIGRRIRRLAADLVSKAPETALLFVNLHPADLQDDELYAHYGALTPHAKRVVLEITERVALDGIPGLRNRVERLRALGYRIAVDDLGAGYAGLSSFAALEPDVVKADMSLVRGIEASPIKQKLLRAIATLASDLRVQLIAEGVETASERDCVAALGAHALQGYLFARPARGFPPIAR